MLGKSSKPVLIPRPEPKAQSPPKPRALLKSFDFGGVGLGIVAALEKPGSTNKTLFARNLSRSNPLHPVRSATAEAEAEDYNSTTSTTSAFRLQSGNIRGSVFHISPAKIGDVAGVPPADFLSACNLCRKGLHGIDIYMYRGEKAFCSPECRYREMAMDERAEKCSTATATASASATSPNYNVNGQILTNGILAI